MKLHLNTVTDLLWESLQKLMIAEEFNEFRIVGGTSLSLQLGHRESVDIDLFTDAEYGSINFSSLETKLEQMFPHFVNSTIRQPSFGKSYYIGTDRSNLVKLDLYYTDPYLFPYREVEKVRFSTLEEIAAMKLEVISEGGRKKDFWDVHELLSIFTLDQMLVFYLARYPYGSPKKEIIEKLVDFSNAEDDITPNCFRNKKWNLIKRDLERIVK